MKIQPDELKIHSCFPIQDPSTRMPQPPDANLPDIKCPNVICQNLSTIKNNKTDSNFLKNNYFYKKQNPQIAWGLLSGSLRDMLQLIGINFCRCVCIRNADDFTADVEDNKSTLQCLLTLILCISLTVSSHHSKIPLFPVSESLPFE